MSLWQRFDALPAFRLLRESVGKPGEVVLEGLTGAARHTLLRALRERQSRPGLILTPTAAEAQRWADDWQSLDPARPLLLFPEREVLPFEAVTQSPETTRRRLAVLRSLRRDPSAWVVAPVGALLTALTPARVFAEAEMSLRPGLRLALPAFRQQIRLLGYTVEDRVTAVGQTAFRGGIVDLWDPVMEHPLRIEWFDDEIDSMRLFSAEDQRSVRSLDEALIGPAGEGVVPPGPVVTGLATLRSALRERLWNLARTGQREVADRIRERMEGILARFGESPAGSEVDGLLSYFYRTPGLLLDYFAVPPLLVLEEPQRLFETVRAAERGAQERLSTLVLEGAALEGQGAIHLGEQGLRQRLAPLPTLALQGLIRPGERAGVTAIQVQSGGSQVFHGRWPLFLGEVKRRLAEGETVLLFAGSPEGQGRLVDALRAEDLVPLVRTAETADDTGLMVLPVPLSAGFSLPDLRLFAVTEQEIFGQRRRTRARETREEGRRTVILSDLVVGDYVVHESHGVGRYLGLKSMEIGGVQKDYLHIAYQGEDVLYVPTDQLHLVQKYVGQEGFTPRLSKLGGADWQRVKNRVKASVQEMAKDLLELYAARESQVGHAFGPDTPWQAELEERFPYEETRDQAAAIAEIKADMEKPRPMDRLLCGDVGYGKTEVALRAAFKAVMDGKQVAVLVPTTILAQQHAQTFRKRYEGFPVVVEQLSRFRSPREQTQVIRRLKAGEVDVVIGTHRLLAKDVQFKDLGLLIIDEEQRFGVAHKERLKALRRDVESLTMTATPIPRTLHMGLVGIRDMSVIETPPEGRFPVQTYVVEYGDELVADAVRREVARDGQVFYVHNRVQGIERIYRHLQEVLPDVRMTLAHGQMDERLLERNMQAFLEGEYDLLLSTTIIESGLDMPRVNTLIVEDADRFGLSQLYQLRGRIGRSQRLAFAYFTYRADKVLSEEAEKRLSAIREFTQFGAGFKIAMRDLQIRGAGNILGPEQHGHIAAVGFDLYTRLLEEAVGELQGRAPEIREFPAVELDVDAYLPDAYIADGSEKIEIYKRIAGILRPEEAADLALELEDRFGPLPPPVANLLAVARLRIRGEAAGIAQVGRERDRVLLKFRNLQAFPSERLADLSRHFRGRVSFQATPFPHLALRVSGDPLPMVEEVLGILTAQAQTA